MFLRWQLYFVLGRFYCPSILFFLCVTSAHRCYFGEFVYVSLSLSSSRNIRSTMLPKQILTMNSEQSEIVERTRKRAVCACLHLFLYVVLYALLCSPDSFFKAAREGILHRRFNTDNAGGSLSTHPYCQLYPSPVSDRRQTMHPCPSPAPALVALLVSRGNPLPATWYCFRH